MAKDTSTVNSPVDMAGVKYLEGEAQAGVVFEVSEQATVLGPVIFVGVFVMSREEGEGCVPVIV